MAKYNNILNQVVNVFKALSDENRVRALLALHHQELCVCQIVELLGLAPSTVSKHMSILKNAGLVQAAKRGRWVYYRLSGADAPSEMQGAIEWAILALDHEGGLRELKHSTQIQEDLESLKKILKMDPEEICRRQQEC
jgi:ArsR family transcriptional regulator, arsenate/arsenite/antimonite-responsive transcriptional repressor